MSIDILQLIGTITPIVLSIGGYIVLKFKKLETKIEKSMSKEDTKELINDKIKPFDVLQREIKEDIGRLEQKLDRLLEKHWDLTP